jgi:nucleotide-binding universal stress UspA family protein
VSEFGAEQDKETLVAVGQAHAKIVDIAKERNASVIVMTTHGRTGLAHFVMGSVAEKVMRSAPCPVFSVKPRNLE